MGFISASALTAILVLLVVPITTNFAYADSKTQTSNFNVLVGDDLKNNPLAQKMLERIEIMKQRIAEIQQKQKQIDEHQKFIEEQRKVAQQKLNQQLERMEKDNAEHTPKAAFTSFVSKTPEKLHNVYWGMFDYQQSKVRAAQTAMNNILDNGGSYQEARDAYNKIAAIKRVQLIEVTKNLNIENNLADDSIQSTFDKYGKLPRYED